MGWDGSLRSNGRPVSMQYLRGIGVNVCRSIGLEGSDQERKTVLRGATERKSDGRLSRSTPRQGEPITWRPVANDRASFPLNRSAAATTTATDDKASGNSSGFTILLVCAVRSLRIYSSPLISASDRFDDPSCIHDYSNSSPLTFDARNIIDKSVPAPFVPVPNPLAHPWKSALVLGKSGATVPANPDSHPPSVLARAKPVVEISGGSGEKNSAIFESGTHYR